jgi:hypothetical protein
LVWFHHLKTFFFHHDSDSPLRLGPSHKLMTILMFPPDCHKHRARLHLPGILGDGHDLTLQIPLNHNHIK